MSSNPARTFEQTGESLAAGSPMSTAVPASVRRPVSVEIPQRDIDAAERANAVPSRLKWGMALVLCVLTIFILLQNGYYVPNSDGEYYISVARNILLGRGYVYNGEPVGLVPPGWPLVLAGALAISDSFAVVNWVPALMLLGSAAMWFCVLTRLTTVKRAFVATILGATLFWGYHSAILLQSEALFCVILAGMMLLAFQVAEGKPAAWRCAMLLLLCSALVLVRFAGLVTWVVPAAVLLTGDLRKVGRLRVAMAMMLAVTAVGTFMGMKNVLRSLGAGTVASETIRDRTAPPVEKPDAPRSVLLDEKVVVPNVDTQQLSRNIYKVVPRVGVVLYLQRVAESGTWMSTLFWMPAKIAVSDQRIDLAMNIFGWLLLIPMFVWLIVDSRRGQWIWIGLVVSCGLLVLRWSSANERYLIPIAPLLLLGPWLGLEYLYKRFVTKPGGWQRFAKFIVIAPILSVAISNACLVAIDVAIARSDDFYAHHHAGRSQQLVAAAHWLMNDRQLADNELAVSPLYLNLRRPVQNSFAIRVMNVLTDRNILTVPRKVCEGKPDQHLIDWAATNNVHYYLYRPPDSPWRVWHFKAKWLQEWITGEKVTQINPAWELYELKDGQATLLDPPTVRDWPRRLPGVR